MSGQDKPKDVTSSGKTYEAPKVVRVSLRPEEAVLGHCKISGVAGPASGSCTIPGCFAPGS
jgi:hypothetical protein